MLGQSDEKAFLQRALALLLFAPNAQTPLCLAANAQFAQAPQAPAQVLRVACHTGE